MWAQRRTHLVYVCQNNNRRAKIECTSYSYLARILKTRTQRPNNHQQIWRNYTNATRKKKRQSLFDLNRIHLQIDWYFTACRILARVQCGFKCFQRQYVNGGHSTCELIVKVLEIEGFRRIISWPPPPKLNILSNGLNGFKWIIKQ